MLMQKKDENRSRESKPHSIVKNSGKINQRPDPSREKSHKTIRRKGITKEESKHDYHRRQTKNME